MPKNIPLLLQMAKEQEVTTLCRLVKVICKDGDTFGFTSLDKDLTYDDLASSDGALLYHWLPGVEMSRLQSTIGTGIDNANIAGLVSALTVVGLTEQNVQAGKLDFAELWVYLIDYTAFDSNGDLIPGNHEIISRSKWGEVSLADDVFTGESRSLSQIWKQGITQVTSLTCRTQFGSHKCGKSFTWDFGTVTSVDSAEPSRVFTASALAGAAGFYVPGVVLWLTGDNAGKYIEVEEFRVAVAGKVELLIPMGFNIQVGDTFQIRQDCSKVWDDASHGCLYHWGTDRPLHFRGEPLIPIGREGELSTPGAEV